MEYAEAVFFYAFAAVAIGGSLMVIVRRNILHCALFLVLVFFAVAALFVMMDAEFLAAVQVLVYAGAIMVLFLFVILLVQVERIQMMRLAHRQSPLVVVVTLVFLGELLFIILRGAAKLAPPAAAPAQLGSTESFGALLYTDYIFPFEVASVLLLAAMIGAIILARRDDEEDEIIDDASAIEAATERRDAPAAPATHRG